VSFKQNFEWQEQFVPIVKAIVGPLLLVPAPFKLDTEECTDFLTLKARDMRIGCRIRRPGYEIFHHQFTLRCKLDSGAKTELEKIMDGWCDWLFYAHATQEGELRPWYVIDLNAFRTHINTKPNESPRLETLPKQVDWGKRANNDGTHFVWFDVRSFPPKPEICVSQTTSPAGLPVGAGKD
jgi:hypothetical protein